MYISEPEVFHDEKVVRIAATVRWEDCGLPEREVFIETEGKFAEDVSPNPHAFLVGCYVPAMHFGEKRIRMDAKICPLLRDGLKTTMAVIEEWSGGQYKPMKLDVKPRSSPHPQKTKSRAGLFLSGGMDSLAALRLNKMDYPDSHPGSVKDCLLVHGFDIGGVVERGMKYPVFDRAKAALSDIAEDANVNLIPVYTNIRHLCDERDLWLEKFFGAHLAAVAHAFDSRLNLIHVASSYDLPNLGPCGSHPLLDPYYSSYEMRIIHRDLPLTRLDKIRIVADWDVAFQNFRVCLANVTDRLNCGKCEKCVRTMTALVAIGALHKTRAFVENDVTPEQLSGFNIRIRHREPFYEEMLPLLRKQGRDDLVTTIERMLAR